MVFGEFVDPHGVGEGVGVGAVVVSMEDQLVADVFPGGVFHVTGVDGGGGAVFLQGEAGVAIHAVFITGVDPGSGERGFAVAGGEAQAYHEAQGGD